jgi:hypothetical protein
MGPASLRLIASGLALTVVTIIGATAIGGGWPSGVLAGIATAWLIASGVAIIFGLMLAGWTYRRFGTLRDPLTFGRCPNCGYSLYGSIDRRCPECGTHAGSEATLDTWPFGEVTMTRLGFEIVGFAVVSVLVPLGGWLSYVASMGGAGSSSRNERVSIIVSYVICGICALGILLRMSAVKVTD